MKTIFLKPNKTISEANEGIRDILNYNPTNIIVEGLLSVTGKKITNTNVIEAFGIELKKEASLDEVQQEFIAENLYNPLLTIHNLRKAGRIDTMDEIAEAYENFIGLVNRAGLEMEKENQAIIESAVKIFKKATE
jgi:chromosome segregation and condensation protein ScpB